MAISGIGSIVGSIMGSNDQQKAETTRKDLFAEDSGVQKILASSNLSVGSLAEIDSLTQDLKMQTGSLSLDPATGQQAIAETNRQQQMATAEATREGKKQEALAKNVQAKIAGGFLDASAPSGRRLFNL